MFITIESSLGKREGSSRYLSYAQKLNAHQSDYHHVTVRKIQFIWVNTKSTLWRTIDAITRIDEALIIIKQIG